MKKLTISIFLSLLLCAVLSVLSNAAEVEKMTDKVIRLHVIANSDSEADQTLKLKVRDSILAAVSDAVADCDSKDEALERISANISEIKSAAEQTVSASGEPCPLSCTLGRETFDRRTYDDFELPAGEYDSLIIRLGAGEGKNWWCVCYPSLCLGAAVSVDDCPVFCDGELRILKEPEKARYKLWCFELIRKIGKILK